jgi:hypothetical protein
LLTIIVLSDRLSGEITAVIKKHLFLVMCLTSAVYLLLSGCSSPQPVTTTSFESPIPSEYISFTAEGNLFSISYPPDWGVEQEMLSQAETNIKNVIAKRDAGQALDEATIIFVGGLPPSYVPAAVGLVEPLPPGISSQEQLVAAKVDSFRASSSDYREIKRTDTTMGGIQATVMEYRATLGGTDRHDVVSFFIADGMVWSITCASVQSEFASYQDIFYSVARSLRVPGITIQP